MNICIVNALFPPHVSGSARLSFMLGRQLSLRGHRVVVITSQIEGASPLEKCDGMIVYRLRSFKYPKLQIFHKADLYFTLLPQNLPAVVSILRRHRVEVVHIFGQFFDLTLIAVSVSKILRIPCVLSICTRMMHTLSLYNTLLYLGDRILVKHLVARRVRRIVALDEPMRDYIFRRYSVGGRFVRFIPTAVDAERFEKADGSLIRKTYRMGQNDPVIVSVGAISNLRNPASLIRAFSRVIKRFPNSKLLLVGPLYSTEARRLVNVLRLGRSVIFCGKVDYGLVPSYLAACDVEAHDLETSMGFGLASLEAMAAGKPVLSPARKDNFICAELQDGNNMVRVRPGDPEDISNALVRLISDKKLRETIGRNARRFVRTHFSPNVICQRSELLYGEVVTKRSPPQ
jgi:glycosyltransferase involved in cell wall biosynthesis